MSSNSTNQPAQGEAAFKKLAETVRISLQTFNAIQTIPSSGTISSPLRLAVSELTNAAVCDISLFLSTTSLTIESGQLCSVSSLQWPSFIFDISPSRPYCRRQILQRI